MNTTMMPAPRQHAPGISRHGLIVTLMGFEALTLALFSALHLSGTLRVGSGTGPSYGAGIAEAVICLALLAGLSAFARRPAAGRRAALLAAGFGIFGFAVGLTFTVSGGDLADLAYHAVMIPILAGTAILLARPMRASQRPADSLSGFWWPRTGGSWSAHWPRRRSPAGCGTHAS